MNTTHLETSIKPSVAVIGGGIIGVTSAINLLKRGFDVTLIEKEAIAAGASTGNCGLMAVGEIVPISKPGVLSQVPGWLTDPTGPISVRPLHAITMTSWFMQFLKAGRPENVQHIAKGLTQLSAAAAQAYQPLLKSAGIEDLLQPYEVLYLFDEQKEIAEGQYDWDLRLKYGFNSEFLDHKALHDLEPEISQDIACAMLMKGWDYFADPARLTKDLARHFVEQGGRIRIDKVAQFDKQPNHVTDLTLESGEVLSADYYVIAAGAWTPLLSNKLGDYIPLEAMAGYNTTIAKPNVQIKHPLLHHHGGFVITPMEMGIRVGGTLELGGLNSKPNFKRAQAIVEKAQKILPNLQNEDAKEWVGYRPMMPDTLPVIDRSPRFNNVIYACGHGQLGITYGAISGELVADMITSEASMQMDMSFYRADRF